MKVQYFAVLALASLLSLGAISSCANPCAAKPTNSDNQVQEVNPCASKSNPCASKSNPCASKSNPCASKSKSIGTPLVQELQGKPVLVDIFASWCPACKNIAPTLAQLEKDYAGKVNFVVLDVSDKSTTAEAEAKAQQLRLSEFLAANKSQTGMLTIIDPATGNILAQYRNNANLRDYTTVLDAALAQ
jgi:thiol-disulfide isomerase/thioredoxin